MNKTIITEDYVSFEVAKLLKEKGFDESFFFYYRTDDEVKNVYYICGTKPLSYHQKYIDNEVVAAPTLSMAMKWLRTKHNISVEVYRTACGYVGCIVAIPSGTDIKFLDKDGDDLSSGQYTKWEYACETAIKYYLEHLETLIGV